MIDFTDLAFRLCLMRLQQTYPKDLMNGEHIALTPLVSSASCHLQGDVGPFGVFVWQQKNIVKRGVVKLKTHVPSRGGEPTPE